MGWQVNNGFDRLATYHPAAAFTNRCTTPT
jgi:hypothetical protein